MHDVIIDKWTSFSPIAQEITVIPDGCRDLIMREDVGVAPVWSVSPLFDQSQLITTHSGTKYLGFRMKAGVRIDEHGLLELIRSEKTIDINSFLGDFARYDTNVDEVLLCLASDIKTVDDAARQLGVKIRTLQRLLMSNTERPPSYWLMLARARKTAADILRTNDNSDIAYKHGYSDQAHLCRDIKRWFNKTPSELKRSTNISAQLNNNAYP
ncbi:MAG: helix-turn-helix transcriptional regulator [Emcibacteraceae bacterium]|nr:helix-turn-helix transcriptional regulator [Emcibacteraceae bacterium]